MSKNPLFSDPVFPVDLIWKDPEIREVRGNPLVSAISAVYKGEPVKREENKRNAALLFASGMTLQTFEVRLIRQLHEDCSGLNASRPRFAPAAAADVENIRSSDWRSYALPKALVKAAAFDLARQNMLKVCLGLQPLDLPALLTVMILREVCAPAGSSLRFRHCWAVAVKVKSAAPSN